MTDCMDGWFSQRAEVLASLAKQLQEKQEGRKHWPKAKQNTRWLGVQTAEVIVYRKDAEPVVVTKLSEGKLLVEGLG